jgi:hypothetical protein
MTEKEFVIWLHGFLEISESKTLAERQVQIIKDHLNEFFVKVTPEREEKNNDWSKLIEKYKLRPQVPMQPMQPMHPDAFKITCSNDSTGKFQPLDLTKTYC